MISAEQVAEIRRLFHAEHWKVGTIATQLDLHPDTVRTALNTDRFNQAKRLRSTKLDRYIQERYDNGEASQSLSDQSKGL